MDLVKLAIQDPLWSLKSPLAAARPGFPLAKPSVLSLKKLTRGGVQLMWVMLFLVGALFVGIRCHMLWARDFARIEIAWAKKGVLHDELVAGCPNAPSSKWGDDVPR
ncbi:hypothetical protein ACJW31_04G066300 [Castanea mollissima]